MEDLKDQKGFFEAIGGRNGFFLGLGTGVLGLLSIGFVILAVMVLTGRTPSDGASAAPAPSQAGVVPVPDRLRDVAVSFGVDADEYDSCVNGQEAKAKVEEDFQEGSKNGIQGTPATFIGGELVSGALPYESLKAAIDKALAGKGTKSPIALSDRDHVIGNLKSNVTVVEFSDFQCPFCSRFKPTVDQLLKDYGDKVKFAYKHFPLDSIHQYARPAAVASECVAKQLGTKGFYEFHDALFENQSALFN